MARILLVENLYDRDFVRRWTNWQEFLKAEQAHEEPSFERFIEVLKEVYKDFTPEFAEQESGVPAQQIIDVARLIGDAGSRFASHIWRSAASGNIGGWQVARALQFLTVLTGSVGTRGGTLPHGWNKFKPQLPSEPPLQKQWNELLYPREYPLSHYRDEYSPSLLLE